MLHARNFYEVEAFRKEMYDFNPSIEGRTHGKPVIAQIAGDNPKYLVGTAKLLELSGVDAIDLNLGCPQQVSVVLIRLMVCLIVLRRWITVWLKGSTNGWRTFIYFLGFER